MEGGRGSRKLVIDETGQEWFIGEWKVAIVSLMQGNQEDGRAA